MQNVEDLYPLTGMQRLMLLHARAPGADALHDQFVYTLRGSLDVRAFRASWEQVLRRHSGLRAAFVWGDLPDPLQVVRGEVELELVQHDWSELSEAEVERARSALLAEDKERGFALDRAPLMRLALCRREAERHELLWSSHHLILDRWCTAVVLGDFARAYADSTAGLGPAPLAPAGRFRDYLAWVQAQDPAAAEAFWRGVLAGAGSAARALTRPASNAPGGRASLMLSADDSACWTEGARGMGMTLPSLAQAAWGLVFGRHARARDVVFGVTVSGRPPGLEGVETTVGSFVSNVPVRLSLDPDAEVGAWLGELQRVGQERAAFEYLAASELQNWSGLSAGEPLFDALFVWLAADRWEAPAGLSFEAHEGRVETAWPLTLAVGETPAGLELTLECAPGRATPVPLDELLEQWREAALELASSRGARLGELRAYAALAADSIGQNGHHARNGHATRVLEVPGQDAPAAQGREGDELAMVLDMLLTECRTALGVEQVAPEDSFFELGGDSLRAAQLHGQIERVMGRSIPLLPLFEAPTIRDMAIFLTREQWPVRGGIVRALQPVGSRTPLFCLSSPEVNSLGYLLLARHLDPDQPSYVVQTPPGTHEVLRMGITQVPEFTERYLAGIRAVQPSGPYRLLGMCDGAVLALEVARRLVAEGEQVEYLGVLNTFSLYTLSRLNHLRRVEVRARYYGERLGEFRRQPFTHKRREVSRVLRQRAGSVARKAGIGETDVNGADAVEAPAVEPAQTLAAAGGPSLESIHREWQDLDWPHLLPEGPRYPGKVILYRIRKQPYFRIRDRAMGWGRQVEQVEVVDLETSAQSGGSRDKREWREGHLEILREPDVRLTAAAVEASLRALEEKTP